MGRYTGKTCRLLCMVCLTASFFLVEIIVGYMTNSLALVGDAYHMLSDVIALIVGIASVRIAKWHSRKNTYGWARAEVLGALINAVFLIALCFTIFIEALQRMVSDEHIENPDLLLIVGGIGLGINIIGLALFGTHSHSHGGHGHSHGGHGHSHIADGAAKKDDDSPIMDVNVYNPAKITEEKSTNGEVLPHHHEDSDSIDDVNIELEEITRKKMKSSAQLNMRGVFLHVMGDALGSVIVIISALVIKYVDAEWKYKVDPAMSLVLVAIILSTSIPLMKESALILLQTVPTHIQVQDLQKRLVSKVKGVIAVHEFHIWQLAGNRIIASAHIHCQNLRDYMRIAEEVKLFFHNEGIHSTTIQPEFVEEEPMIEINCILPCIDDCQLMQCCHERHKSKKAPTIFKNCYQRRKRNHDDSLMEIVIDPDDKQALVKMSNDGESTRIPTNDEVSDVKTDTSDHSKPGVTFTPKMNGDVDHGVKPEPVVLDASGLENKPLLETQPAREHPRSYSEPPKVLPSSGSPQECSTLPRRKYRPMFSPPNSMPQRPQSMYEMPRLSDHYSKNDPLRVTPGDVSPQVLFNSHLEDNNRTTSVPIFTTSEANINQAIKQLKHDLRTIRGDVASRESFLDQ